MARPKRVAFVSLGCPKALVDTEKMLGQLGEAGCIPTNDEADADVIVLNTCGFLAAARDEAVDHIRQAVAIKNDRKTRCRRVVVVGCLVQRDGTDLLDRVGGIDALVGVHNRDDVVRAVLSDAKVHRGRVRTFLGDYHPSVNLDTGRLRVTPRHYTYLRISEGCDQKCTFCTIPAIRGKMHCKPSSVVLAEARELAADGAVEIILIGQDTTSYGRDAGCDAGLAGLLRELDRVDGVKWIRLMYTYPSSFPDEVIDALAECENVVNYVDLPLQHINDRILKAMGRGVDRAATENLLERIRAGIPGVHVRTTMIVGFPGETESEFEELVEFVRDSAFDALGAFVFSPEPDTIAGRMDRRFSDTVKQERLDALMTVQQRVAFDLAQARVGQTFDVLIDGPPTDGFQPARHAGQAPEVDALTLLADGRFAPGEFVTVRCTGRRGYDLLAAHAESKLSAVSGR